ncbi:unnamed protein product [Amoebophrya sp. A120]|nr:unnamed protein product [Amoebophrya sp. A120]|eukprot:GSA120T00007647001.1
MLPPRTSGAANPAPVSGPTEDVSTAKSQPNVEKDKNATTSILFSLLTSLYDLPQTSSFLSLKREAEERGNQLQLYFTKSEARDKTARLVQYFCKALTGFCTYFLKERPEKLTELVSSLLLQRWFLFLFSSPSWSEVFSSSTANDNSSTASITSLTAENVALSSALKASFEQINTKAKSVQTAMSDARRTHRWAKEFIVLSKVKQIHLNAQKDWIEFVNLISKMLLAVYLVKDHHVWLCKVKLLSHDPKPLIQYNLRYMIGGNVFSAFYQCCLTLRHHKQLRKLEKEMAFLERDAMFTEKRVLDEMLGGTNKPDIISSERRAKSKDSTAQSATPDAGLNNTKLSTPNTKKITELDVMRLADYSAEQAKLAAFTGRISGGQPVLGGKVVASSASSSKNKPPRKGSLDLPPALERRRGSSHTGTGGGGYRTDSEVGSAPNTPRDQRQPIPLLKRSPSIGSRGRASSIISSSRAGNNQSSKSKQKREERESLARLQLHRRSLGLLSNDSASVPKLKPADLGPFASSAAVVGQDDDLDNAPSSAQDDNQDELFVEEIRSAPTEDARNDLLTMDRQEELRKQMLFHRVKRRDSFLLFLKSLLLIAQGLHNSGLHTVHDFPIGLLGVVSSMIDMRNLWPPRQAV